jgi:hypothetical protein
MTIPANAAAWASPGFAKKAVCDGVFAAVRSETTGGIPPFSGTSSRQRQTAVLKLTKHAKTQIHSWLRINSLA